MDNKILQQTAQRGNKILARREVIAKLRQEIERLRHSDSPQVLHFVDTMIFRYPDLRP